MQGGNIMRTKILIPVVVVTAAVVLVIMGYGIFLVNQKSVQLRGLQEENIGLSENIHDRDSVINGLLTTFNEIDDNLSFIKTRRGRLTLEASKEVNANRKAEILADIRLMDSMLVVSGQHIESLEKRLKDSGVRMQSFENRIAGLNRTISENTTEIAELRRTLEDREMQIADLSTKIEIYQTVIEEREEEIQQKELTIIDRQNQLNTAWYTMGSFKELKEHGVLSRSGGILGIGSTKTLQKNLDKGYFTVLDIRETKTIPIASKTARIITEHPDDSYELIVEDGLISALVIENPDEFWRISKYAVIETR
jgi:hypothetical protein